MGFLLIIIGGGCIAYSIFRLDRIKTSKNNPIDFKDPILILGSVLLFVGMLQLVFTLVKLAVGIASFILFIVFILIVIAFVRAFRN